MEFWDYPRTSQTAPAVTYLRSWFTKTIYLKTSIEISEKLSQNREILSMARLH